MKSCKEELRERIQEYIPDYRYEQGRDMVAILFHIMEEQLLHQQHLIQQLPYQKQNQLWKLCNVKDQKQLHPEVRIQLVGEEPVHLTKGTIWIGEDQEGNELTYEQTAAFQLQHASVCAIINVDGETQTIIPQYIEDQACIIHQGIEGVGAQCNALCFHIPHFFDHMTRLEFDLYLDCDEELKAWLCDSSIVEITIGCETHQALVNDIKATKHGIHIRYERKEQEVIEVLWFRFIQGSCVHPVHLWDARFFWSGKHRHCDVVIGEDRIFTEDEIPMFDSPMELYASCYIGANEVLRQKGATITLQFEAFTRCVDQGMELLQKQPYKAVMRKLPLELPVYDAYADIVIMEYFNGTAWCMIDQTQGIQTAFHSVKKALIQVSFVCPNDITPIEVMGKDGYYIRFRLTRSEHLYQQPCHIHVPYLTHIRFSYEQTEGQRAECVRLYSELSEYDMTSALGNQGCILFSQLPIKKQACLIGFDQLQRNEAIHLLVHVLESNATGAPMKVSYARSDEAFHEQHIEDHTNGLSHSGELTVWIPDDIACVSLFGITAYWLCVQYQDGILPNTTFKFIQNTLLLQHKSGSMTKPVDLHPSETDPIAYQIIEGPYGIKETRTEEQERNRIAHQYVLRNRGVSEYDMKKLLLDEIQELDDLVILQGITQLGEACEFTHFVVLFYDILVHHHLFLRNSAMLHTYTQEIAPLCKGEIIIVEPIFVEVELELYAELTSGSIWEETKALTKTLDALLKHRWKLDERIDKAQVLSYCQSQLPHILVKQLMLHASYSYRGQTASCLWEDLAKLHGMCLLIQPYRLHLHEVRSSLC